MDWKATVGLRLAIPCLAIPCLDVALAGMTRVAVAAEADCVKARDGHGDFKAILNDDPSGKPQFETVKHAPDGTVEITRWVAGRKQSVRLMAGGVFIKTNRVFIGDRETEFAYSRTIDVSKALPLQPNTTLRYTITAVRSGTFSPILSDATSTVGPAYKTTLDGCELQVIGVKVDAKNAQNSSVAETVFAPALAYPLEVKLEARFGSVTRTQVSKVLRIEPWKD